MVLLCGECLSEVELAGHATSCSKSERADVAPGPMRVLDFFVPGVPAPQGSKKVIPNRSRRPGARPYLLIDDNPPALLAWRTAVSEMARVYMGTAEVLEGVAVIVEATFLVPRPPSVPRRVRYPAVRPDADKYARAVGDALTGIIYRDDGMVVDWVARKRYVGDPGEREQRPGVHLVVRTYSEGVALPLE